LGVRPAHPRSTLTYLGRCRVFGKSNERGGI
jgi:hypothetical protein